MPSPDHLRDLPFRYRALLALLPRHVRDEHGRELRDDLLERAAPPGSLLLDILRAAPGAHWDVLRQDLRLAFRQLRRAPAFALVAGLTLALGIGGNVAFFTLIDAVLLRQLPLAGAERIVDITEENVGRDMRNFGMSPANFRDVARDTSLFQATAIYNGRSGTVRVGETRERIPYTAVSGGFFQVFTDPPFLGRALQPDDDVQGSSSIVVSYAFWRRVLGGDPSVIGRRIDIDEKPLTIIGVMPERFEFPSAATAFWAPLALSEAEWQRRGARFVSAAARLRPGVTIPRAAATAQAMGTALASQYPRTNEGWSVLVRELRAARTSGVRTPLLFVWAAGALVLVIAIANVGSLFIARAVAREREVALRAALGARSGRVVRQLVTEGLVLTVLAATAGMAIARFVLAAIRPIASDFVPRMNEVAIDWSSVAYVGLLVLLTTVLLAAVATSPLRGMRIWRSLGATRSGATRQRRRLQRAIVVGEVALAVFVLVAGGLVARTLVGLLSQPMGFESRNLLTFRIEPPWRTGLVGSPDTILAALGEERRRTSERYTALFEQLQQLPGVSRAGAINRLPLTGNWWTTGVRLQESAGDDDKSRMPAFVRPVTPGYLEAMGTRILRGRGVSTRDASGAERVVAIDEEFARQAWGETDPLGRELLLDGPPNKPSPRARVIGVVQAVHMNQLDAELRPTIYVPFDQALEGHYLDWGMDVVLRGASTRLENDIRRLSAGLFPNAVVFGVMTMDEVVASSTAGRRFQLLVIGCFAALALVLTTIGVGGILLLSVGEKRRELAVQLALGARPDRLWWRVQRDAVLLVGGGALIGVAAAMSTATVFSSLVYGVSVRDPLALASGPVLVLIAAFVAAAIPATRAVRVSPIAALRE